MSGTVKIGGYVICGDVGPVQTGYQNDAITSHYTYGPHWPYTQPDPFDLPTDIPAYPHPSPLTDPHPSTTSGIVYINPESTQRTPEDDVRLLVERDVDPIVALKLLACWCDWNIERALAVIYVAEQTGKSVIDVARKCLKLNRR